MKLAKGFVTQNYRDELLMVAVGPAGKSFHGLVRSNATAAFLIEKLKQDVTLDELVAALIAEYEVEPERARRDVEAVLGQLRSIGALES